MNCSVNISTENANIDVRPLAMSNINIKANGLINLPYIADYTNCYMTGYTKLRNNVSGKTHKFYEFLKY